MFYKEGYFPVTYKKCKVSFQHNNYTKEFLKSVFKNDTLDEYNNYLIVKNYARN